MKDQISCVFPPGSSLCTDAVSLVKHIIRIMQPLLKVNKSHYCNEDILAVAAVIKKIRKEVSC